MKKKTTTKSADVAGVFRPTEDRRRLRQVEIYSLERARTSTLQTLGGPA